MDESERCRAESQWMVAARPLYHLQYPIAHVPLGAKWPLLLVDKRAAGACIASSPDSDCGGRSLSLRWRAPVDSSLLATALSLRKTTSMMHWC
ncbi:hypothetical protein RHMOL_Rhmol11G0045800 [Rhododendron molle]|uniref:Uncharacterized protein n=1 Tax=Rhododendron molle TaxID=49168 RepID=A0ACC0LPN3_RHOML|nr:hypothetical protein RHMOL_Rhmol11G0045800 [Rhododendron molle]